MLIIYGRYSTRIKSLKPEELDLKPVIDQPHTIEIRQQIFHIFWIPIFPLKKIFSIRKNGKLYDLPLPYTRAVMTKKWRTPLYSYALIIIFAVFIFHRPIIKFIQHNTPGIEYKIVNHQEVPIDKWFQKNLIKQINELRPENVLIFETAEKRSPRLFLRILAVEGNLLKCQKVMIYEADEPLEVSFTTLRELEPYMVRFNVEKEKVISSVAPNKNSTLLKNSEYLYLNDYVGGYALKKIVFMNE